MAKEIVKKVQPKDLDDALAMIEKKHGKGSIMRFASDENFEPCPSFPSGSIALDSALGVGGYPRGRIVEVYGPESSGKTTLTLHAVAEAQKAGLGTCAFIDVEHALDKKYGADLGVDWDKCLVSQPDCGEDALDIAETLVMSGEVPVIVIDSVAALVPRAELEGDMGQSHVGLQARLMSQGLRKLVGICAKKNVTIFFINQIRMKIGVMFGSPETTSGGNALKFYSSVRLDVRRIATIREGDNAVSIRARVKVVKNKVAPPLTLAEFDIAFGIGINHIAEVLDFGVETEIVEKSGAWYSHGGDRIGQGRLNAIEYLRDNPTKAKEIEDAVRKSLA